MDGRLITYLPALLLYIYQTQVLWKKLPNDEGFNLIFKGKYTKRHLLIYVLFKYFIYLIFCYQFFYSFLPIFNTKNSIEALLTLGYILFVFGFLMSVLALKSLGNSWTSMMFYGIKNGHYLVKTKIYKYVRHPIYGSVILEIAGFGMILNSWSFLLLLIFSIAMLNIHIKNEEKLLVKYFGKEYLDYKKSTKRYIPFIC